MHHKKYQQHESLLDLRIYNHTSPSEQLCGETDPEQELHWAGITMGTHLEFIHILPSPHLAPFGTCPGSIPSVYK